MSSQNWTKLECKTFPDLAKVNSPLLTYSVYTIQVPSISEDGGLKLAVISKSEL